jgi:energy-coupling factor transport system substrate-specific component
MSSTAIGRDESTNPMWEVTSRTIVYAAIGAALYAIAAQFSFLLPGTANVSLRPGFALVTFFGFAFGPLVGLFVGLVGNALADQISGWGLLTSWGWSVANGLAGLLVGILAYSMRDMVRNRLILAAVASVIAVIVGFIFVFTDIWLGTAENFSAALADNYLPVVIANVIVSAILTPILVAAWDPVRESMGR